MEEITHTVFGDPITDRTLTQVERAMKARSMKDKLNIDSIISYYLAPAICPPPSFTVVFTCCKIYNATGDTVKFVKKHNYHGYASSYPPEIANGQYGMFLHKSMTPKDKVESSGAVVYRGKNKDGQFCDWMYAWRHIISSGIKQAYTEVNKKGHFDDDAVWEPIYAQLCKSGQTSEDTAEKCESHASIGGKTVAMYDGVMTILEE